MAAWSPSRRSPVLERSRILKLLDQPLVAPQLDRALWPVSNEIRSDQARSELTARRQSVYGDAGAGSVLRRHRCLSFLERRSGYPTPNEAKDARCLDSN